MDTFINKALGKNLDDLIEKSMQKTQRILDEDKLRSIVSFKLKAEIVVYYYVCFFTVRHTF